MRYLKILNASAEQRTLFKETFPDGCCEVTVENALKALYAGLDIKGITQNALPAPAWEAYQEATAETFVRIWMECA